MLANYKIGPAHSSAQFSAGLLMISHVRGGFGSVQGTVAYDPQNMVASKIDVEIDVTTTGKRGETPISRAPISFMSRNTQPSPS